MGIVSIRSFSFSFFNLITFLYHFFPLEQAVPLSGSSTTEVSSSNETASLTDKDRYVDGEYPYDRLRVVSANPVTGINLTKREVLN